MKELCLCHWNSSIVDRQLNIVALLSEIYNISSISSGLVAKNRLDLELD